MRNTLILLLVIAATALGYMAYSQSVAIKELEARVKTNNLDLQEKCAKQAREEWKLSGWENEKLAGFENHYNEKLGRCFVIMHDTDAKSYPGTVVMATYLEDAFENRNIGSYY